MCAKKATPAAKPAAKSSHNTRAVEKNGAAAATTSPAKSAAAKSTTSAATAVERKLSNEDIGAVAGEIWGLLVRKDAQTLTAIKKSVAAPGDVVVAAIGWLAREDKLQFSVRGRSRKVSLNS
jgi:hypothetical protein